MRFRRPRLPPDTVLLASGFGDDTGGGLFAVDEDGVEQLDTLSSTGLALADGRLVRLLRAPAEPGFGSELLVYDERGVISYMRLDEVDDPHDVLWDGNSFVIVSSTRNAIFWIGPSGEIVRRWQAPGEGDAWHLNSLATFDGKLAATAFGEFDSHRAWTEQDPVGAGFVFDLETGERLVSGLTCPHDPRLFDGGWVVCNSKDHELVACDAAGHVTRRLRLNGWTRGIATSKRSIFVGESAARDGSDVRRTASIAVVSQPRWRVVDRTSLPSREVYDLLFVPRGLVSGIRAGFRTNPLRTAEQEQHDLFLSAGVRPARLWATGEPLPPDACRITVAADLPDRLALRSVHRFECTVTNEGNATLVSAPPNPVHVSYRWLEGPDGADLEEGLRSPLPEPLPPGSTARCRAALRAPATPGEYAVRITLVQEQIRWFDEVDGANAWTMRLRVT